MTVEMRRRLLGLALALAGAWTPARSMAQAEATVGTLTRLPFDLVTPNPTGIKMSYYVPATGTAPMPIVVGLHSCQGNEDQVMGWLKGAADTYGFMLAVPFANRVDANAAGATGCWDVGSADALAAPPDNLSDPAAIAALVDYLGTTLKCGAGGDAPACGDLAKVYATGQSSGAMMTNVLLGLYPDVFQAGASFMGVPFGCWATGVGGAHPAPGTATVLGAAAGWSGDCASGSVRNDAAGWVALLPEHAGTWPRMQIFHGEQDTLISYVNFAEQVDQWTGVHDLSAADSTDYPVAPGGHTWTRTRYGGSGPQATVEAIHIRGTDHFSSLSAEVAPEIVRFFGLGDSTAPAAPTALSASNVTETGATLTWTAATDDVAVNNYVVYRVNGGTSTAVAWPTGTTYAVTGLTAETAYTYEVVAADRAGNLSPASDPAQFTTAAAEGGGGGGGCGQGAPSGVALLALTAAALLWSRRRTALPE
jgi:poly(hydroxyalkanoate) depolymerase family esterase